MTIDLDRIANLAEMARDTAAHMKALRIPEVRTLANCEEWNREYGVRYTPYVTADCALREALSPDVVLRMVAVCRAAKAYRDEPSPDEHTGPYRELLAALAALDGVES